MVKIVTKIKKNVKSYYQLLFYALSSLWSHVCLDFKFKFGWLQCTSVSSEGPKFCKVTPVITVCL